MGAIDCDYQSNAVLNEGRREKGLRTAEMLRCGES